MNKVKINKEYKGVHPISKWLILTTISSIIFGIGVQFTLPVLYLPGIIMGVIFLVCAIVSAFYHYG